MVDDEDVSMQETPARTEEESGSGSGSSSDEEEEPQVEWLATGREKRSTAGNRLHSLLQQEEADAEDELELLFAEAEDDVGFSDVEADSDVQMDESSDDEDQGPAAGDDDLDGEKELQKQARAEKLKKRKAERGMPKGFMKKKRVKIDATIVQANTAPVPRPKKKSERASWLPTADEAPTRASARGTTKESKQQLHAQMVDREIKRLNQLRQMEKAAAKKEAAKKPAMTQEDRLKEAARVERSNARSLSRWERAEQEREEEQLAKLAALKNRVLEGPVITWWSGVGEWVGGKLSKVGKNLVVEEKERSTKKKKAVEMEESETGSVVAGSTKTTQEEGKKDGEKGSELSTKELKAATFPTTASSVEEPKTNPNVNKEPSLPGPVSSKEAIPKEATPKPEPLPERRYTPTVPSPRYTPSPGPQPPNSSVLAPPAGFPMSAPPYSSVLAPPAGLPLSAPPLPPNMFHRQYPMPSHAFDGSVPLPGFGSYPPRPPPVSVPTPPVPVVQEPVAPQEDLPPKIEHAACNYFILENFDEVAIKDKNVQTQIIFGRKFLKAPRSKHSHEICVITGHPARYRDPHTGLPYHNSYAYKEIQKLKRSEYKWSKLVGAYFGPGGFSARGVPDRFRNANAAAPVLPRVDAAVAAGGAAEAVSEKPVVVDAKVAAASTSATVIDTSTSACTSGSTAAQ
ncbi:related to VPS72 Component of the Swr1p complex that incorporates Htz1p into chromatin [Rhynchosporium agropyri]|uniref:Related to VPS72 Component of the Swr1p complex that incorporates Htz1p into chromatin n=1 Tax=Rhynchosporium agropyri TaxID=914238 RepID=A0A1E1LNZ3_9HELO|nr:related to VPS72 Component of the Swr1p complex that incorporates Htz1p into chromatin [Rhynchosporium agropyri]